MFERFGQMEDVEILKWMRCLDIAIVPSWRCVPQGHCWALCLALFKIVLVFWRQCNKAAGPSSLSSNVINKGDSSRSRLWTPRNNKAS